MENTKVNRLLALVQRPSKKKEPSNFALWFAWFFYNAVALLFDVIAATTIYEMMNSIIYAGLTFAAGFIPLLMHEFLYMRAYAGYWQKVIAVLGAILSVVTILTVGVLAALVNLTDFQANKLVMEVAMIVMLVLVSGGHGLLAAVYFYIDDGIKAEQVRAENMAYHKRRLEDIARAQEILEMADKGMKEEDQLAAQYGGMNVLEEILGQLRGESAPQSPTPPQIVVDLQKGFVKKEAVSASPLSELDRSET